MASDRSREDESDFLVVGRQIIEENLEDLLEIGRL
jgi:hypothetical protein